MIYFDNAATSFQKPEQVARIMYETMVNYGANAGRGGHALSVRAGEVIYETRELLCKLFHIQDVERLVFCQNTTHALNMGIKGILRPGDHVIITSMEHNSVLRPIETLRRNGVISYSIIRGDKNGKISLAHIAQAIRPNTKLLIMTHVSNVCGNTYDIISAAKLAHEHHIFFMVDAAQSAGVLDIDAEQLDLFAFPGHKGLMGPQGTGGLYVRKGLELSTIIEGGTGSASESYMQPEEYPDRLESGTQNVPAIAGLGEGVKFILREGGNNIRKKEKELTNYFIEGISNLPKIKIYGDESRLGVVALNVEGVDCIEVSRKLDEEYQIATRGGLHCAILAHETLGTKENGCVRFSFGYFNTKREVDRAIYAMFKIVQGERSSRFFPSNPLHPYF